jgi:hypothetical protein
MNLNRPKTYAVIVISFCFLISVPVFSAGLPEPRGKKAADKLKRRAPATYVIKIKLSSPAPVSIKKAPLKYNKHTAFSFTLDDGYRSAFLCGYPLLNGGRVSPPFADEWKNDEGGDGSPSKGLYYSDGCGHNIPFRLGLAINAASLKEVPANRGNLSWAEVKTMYGSGWDILNHSFHHSTKHGTDYEAEVLENNKAVEQKIGLSMTQFVVPGGESDPGYDMEYAKAAFKYGLSAVATTSGPGPVIPVDTPVDLHQLIFQREFIKSEADSVGNTAMDRYLQTIDGLIAKPETVWYNAFSHGVGNSNLWGISMVFKDFKYYMTSVAKKHGRDGADDLWMAPWQEVYEYIWLRDQADIRLRQNGRDLTILIHVPDMPLALRHRALSLMLDAKSGFSLISKSNSLEVTHNGSGKHNLLNIQFNK